MKVSQWAEIRRLAEVEGLSQRQIAARLRCCWRTVKKALNMEQPPDETRRASRGSILDPYKPKIDALIAKYPELSAMRVLEEIRKEGYPGQICVVRQYLRQTTKERPVDRYQKERNVLRSLSAAPFDSDEIVSVIVNSHARVKFDGNRYSTPPSVARQTAMLRASKTHVRVIYQGQQVACHSRSYDRGQLICDPAHQLEALQRRRRAAASQMEQQFDALGEQARAFHLALCRQPVRTIVHLRRLLKLVRLYGRSEVMDAIARANELQTYDAAYVETILLQQRRRQELPSPTPVRPRRAELVEDIELDEPDPGVYDRLCQANEDDPLENTPSEKQTPPSGEFP